MLFNVVPSPSEQVLVKKFDGSVFPKFQQLFEVPPDQSPLKFLVLDPAESATALVIENRSGKAITAFCYRWIRADASRDGFFALCLGPHQMSPAPGFSQRQIGEEHQRSVSFQAGGMGMV